MKVYYMYLYNNCVVNKNCVKYELFNVESNNYMYMYMSQERVIHCFSLMTESYSSCRMASLSSNAVLSTCSLSSALTRSSPTLASSLTKLATRFLSWGLSSFKLNCFLLCSCSLSCLWPMEITLSWAKQSSLNKLNILSFQTLYPPPPPHSGRKLKLHVKYTQLEVMQVCFELSNRCTWKLKIQLLNSKLQLFQSFITIPLSISNWQHYFLSCSIHYHLSIFDGICISNLSSRLPHSIIIYSVKDVHVFSISLYTLTLHTLQSRRLSNKSILQRKKFSFLTFIVDSWNASCFFFVWGDNNPATSAHTKVWMTLYPILKEKESYINKQFCYAVAQPGFKPQGGRCWKLHVEVHCTHIHVAPQSIQVMHDATETQFWFAK